MYVGSLISIFLGGAVAPSAVFVEMVHGTVAAATEKAVLVQTDAGSLWISKKALVLRSGGHSYSLARWFRPTEYQWRVLERAARVSGVSAAP